jgi:hypothetical protein
MPYCSTLCSQSATHRHQYPAGADVVDDPVQPALTAVVVAVTKPLNLFSPHDDAAIGVGAENVASVTDMASPSSYADAKLRPDPRPYRAGSISAGNTKSSRIRAAMSKMPSRHPVDRQPGESDHPPTGWTTPDIAHAIRPGS